MFYRIIRKIVKLIAYIIYRINITGQENIPPEGAVIICSNHISGLDCLALAISCKRQIFFMGKRELFDKPVLGWLLKKVGAFPVDRSTTDMKAYRHTMDLLKKDKALGIFSQGTRTADFENVKGGVAVFALKSGAPIVPTGIRGTYRPFSKMYISFGPPISMAPYEGRKVKTDVVDELMAQVVSQVSALS